MFGESIAADGRVRVKICGITNAADAAVAIAAGADSLGFNFWPGSRRYLEINNAASWITALPATIRRVAILVDPRAEEAVTVAALPFIDALQLHGQESPEFCRALRDRGIHFGKAVPVRDATSLQNVPSFGTRTLILDSAKAAQFGGTGTIFPWEFAREFVCENPDLRIVLAGGLTPENVAEAVTLVRPFAVDVTSGVESGSGRKDHGRMRAFIEAAQAA